jgi:formate/nitrite transporter FocA (FNT family)
VLLLGLLGNAIATILLGFAIKYAVPNLSDKAELICLAKLADQNTLQTFIRAIFCGILMYVAVSVYRDNKTTLGILFAIPVFILSGFEHSIADIGYFAISGIVSWEAFGFLWVVIAGNAVGSWILPLLSFGYKKSPKKDEEENK